MKKLAAKLLLSARLDKFSSIKYLNLNRKIVKYCIIVSGRERLTIK